jgi:hypothetical protein
VVVLSVVLDRFGRVGAAAVNHYGVMRAIVVVVVLVIPVVSFRIGKRRVLE